MIALLLGILLSIDPAHSSARFSVEHIFVEQVSGVVPILRGTVDLPAGTLVPTSVTAQLDATRLRTGDDDRDGVLQTADWFETKAFPTWTFASTKIVPAAKGFTMTGLLTIHGVAQSETLDVTVSGTPEHPHYHASAHVDRHAFGIKGNRLDPVIGNPVDVVLDITMK